MVTVAQVVVVAVLLAASTTKIIAPSSRTRMSAFGVTSRSAQTLAWSVLVVVELGLAVAIVAGIELALVVAAVQFAAFALLHWRSLRRGAAGQACGCFGRRGTVSWAAVAQGSTLAVVAALGYVGARGHLTERTLLVIVVCALSVVVVALAAAVLALAREVGIMRIAMQSTGALEIADEGPELGSHVDMSPWVVSRGHDFVLAVFVSDGCPMCRSLGPSLRLLDADPRIVVATFDEERDQDAWHIFACPGAPYAVAIDPDGLVLAKGVANSLPQLESVIATAARRREEPIHA